MKIALVCPYDYVYPGGVASHVSHLKDHFTRMGHKVKIITSLSKRGLRHNGDLIAIGKPLSVPSSGSIARVSLSPWLPYQVKSVLEREKFDIVHIHEPLFPMLPLSVLLQSHSRTVGTFHAYHSKPRAYWLGKPVLKKCIQCLDGRIAVSQMARQFVSRHFPGDYEIIPNGIDINQFSPNVPPLGEFCDGKLNILFVGRMEKRKGLKYLISAYSKIKRQYPKSRLIVVGPGTRLRKDYEKQIEESNLADVVFAGYASAEELPRYYRTADIFCAPATSHESFGIVLLEAMASGTPVVASNMGGYAELIEHSNEGLLVPPKDVGALTYALSSLITDTSLRQQMGAKGRLKAEAYSWERVAQRVLNYYE